ncbi:MAG: DRTGG domain-containing protein [Fervidicoccaceae archaeon]
MAKILHLVGPNYCGKTMLAYGLARKAQMLGLRACYVKPVYVAKFEFGRQDVGDADSLTMREALGLSVDVDLLAPVALPERYLELTEKERANAIERLKRVFEKLADSFDLILAEGYGPPETFSRIGLGGPDVARAIGAQVIFVAGCKGEYMIDRIADQVELYASFFEERGVKLGGVILNAVSAYALERAETSVRRRVEELGVEFLGAIPEMSFVLSPTAREIAQVLEAEVLWGHERLGNVIEEIVAGVLSVGTLLRWLRKAGNAVVIVGGDRPDLLVAALEARPGLVVATEGVRPEAAVISKAKEVEVPLLLTKMSTLEAIERVREAQRVIAPESLKLKEEAIVGAIERHIAWRRLLGDQPFGARPS